MLALIETGYLKNASVFFVEPAAERGSSNWYGETRRFCIQ